MNGLTAKTKHVDSAIIMRVTRVKDFFSFFNILNGQAAIIDLKLNCAII